MGIPAHRAAQCEYCGQPLDSEALGTYQWTSGWVMRREGGGGHGVSLPERAARWAHGYCVDRAIRGTLNQSSLFGG